MRSTPSRDGDGFVAPGFLALLSLALILAAQFLSGLISPTWFGTWSDHIIANRPHFIDRFFAFDGAWYQRIAATGYGWDPSQPGVKQDIAFFPLWPLIERLVTFVAPSTLAARWGCMMVAALFAVASVVAFDRLAMRLLPERTARFATMLYGLWPAACFLLLAYPCGLLNLLCVLALLALLDGALLTAAALAGLASAAGPLALGTSLTVCLAAAATLRSAYRANAAPGLPLLRAVALCLLSVSGLLAFMLWQHVALGDAFAFMQAQRAWAEPAPLFHRLVATAGQLLILPDFWHGAVQVGHAVRATTAVAAQAALERAENAIGLGLVLIGLVAARRQPAWPVLAQGTFTTVLYIWFDGATRPGHATLRLIYPAAASFLGLAILLAPHRGWRLAAVAISAVLLGANAFLIGAGYHVV